MNRNNKIFTKSFFRGASSIVNIFGNRSQYDHAYTGYQKDVQSLASDWNKVGNTLRESMNEYSRKNKKFRAAR